MPHGALVGILDGLTGSDVIVILVVALIVLGPDKLPEISRSMGQWMAKARRIATNLQAEMKDVLDDPSMQPIKEIGEFVAQPRKKLTEFALAAEAESQVNPASQVNAASPAQIDPEADPAIHVEADATTSDADVAAPVPLEATAAATRPDEAVAPVLADGVAASDQAASDDMAGDDAASDAVPAAEVVTRDAVPAAEVAPDTDRAS